MCIDSSNKKVDTCMKNLIRVLNDKGIITKSCCCGHTIYPMTIVAWNHNLKSNVEIMSMKIIPRKKRFYVKDNGGFYYIPETIGGHK